MTDYVSSMLDKTYGNTSLASVLFNKLFIELQEQSEEIEQALQKNDLVLAREITHKLHGSVSFCGLTDIQNLARTMEISLSENHNSEEISNNFHLLKTNILSFIKLKDSILTQLDKAN